MSNNVYNNTNSEINKKLQINIVAFLFIFDKIILQAMKEGYTIRDQEKTHFITATVVDWIDVFTRKHNRDCIIECLDFCIKNKGMILYGYVIMRIIFT
ncbi:transposase [Flavobacterium limnosediminis JC2902]|uniref:Transposase n=1 Tax=Flavobacterium limnosediminis JC2902 TaxID=1341181 RepID=V6SL01_9FLAO|nr:transposase [Flavobacterium limnosediminis JC2902]